MEDGFQYNPWSVEDASVFLKYCCPECDYQVLNYDIFSAHALENHIKSIVLFQSEKDNPKLMIKQEQLNYDEENFDPLCQQNISEGQLDWHMETVHDEKKFGENKQFHCNVDDCTYTSDVKSNFTRHKTNVHEGTIELLQCSFCQFTCTSNNDLYQHYDNQHDTTLFRCNRCDFSDINKTKGRLIYNFSKFPHHIECKNSTFLEILSWFFFCRIDQVYPIFFMFVSLWQYWLSSFQAGGIKLEIFLPKNQHTQRKFLNFENWTKSVA